MLCYKERTIYLHPLLSTSIKQLPTLLKIAQCANKRHLPIEFPEASSKCMFNVQKLSFIKLITLIAVVYSQSDVGVAPAEW